MKLTLKTIVASVALAVASGAALAAGFTPPETAPAAVDRLEDTILKRNHNPRFAEPEDWFRRVTLSGEVNVDAVTSNRTQRQNALVSAADLAALTGVSLPGPLTQLNNVGSRWSGPRSSDVSIGDANLYLMARANDWVRANLDVLYEDSRSLYGYVNQDHLNSKNFNVNEAYVTVGNFQQSPVYFRVGKEYVPFGHYDRHPITMPFTQIMTQTNATAFQLGFVDASGLNGSLFVFRNKVPKADTTGSSPAETKRRVENGGFQIGFRHEQADAGFNIDASWVANMADVDYLSSPIFESVIPGVTISSVNTSYQRSVGAYHVVAQGHAQGWDAEAHYVTASKKFDPSDMRWNASGGVRGAKPSSWMVGVGYTMPMMMGYNSRIGVNYQRSEEALRFGDGFGLAGVPKHRWQADYSVDLMKNVKLGVEYVGDRDYGTSKGGTGKRASTGIIRLSTRFA